jgi:hypothetical protein
MHFDNSTANITAGQRRARGEDQTGTTGGDTATAMALAADTCSGERSQ